VDAGYVDAGLLVESRESYGVELLGPVSRNNQWQAKAGKGYDLSGFEVDKEHIFTMSQLNRQPCGWQDTFVSFLATTQEEWFLRLSNHHLTCMNMPPIQHN